MSKPIEAGCSAVVVNSQCGNNGVTVVVIKHLGKDEYEGCNGEVDVWEIDVAIPNTAGEIGNTCGSHQLKRIDYDGNETCSWESCEWKPAEVTA